MTCLDFADRELDLNARAFARCGFEGEGTARTFGALAHLHQADTAADAGGLQRLREVKAAAIVAHAQDGGVRMVERKIDPDMFCLRVLANIIQGFLG